MSESYHTYGFEVARFILAGMAEMDDEDRASVFEGMRLLYCLFCGKKHPQGGTCECWKISVPKCHKCGSRKMVLEADDAYCCEDHPWIGEKGPC